MAAPKRRKKLSFENSKDMGSFASINFEVTEEHKDGEETHEFDAQIHYYEKGQGRPLLLVHGIGQSLYAWRYSIDFFAQNGFRVIAVDMPGFGYSSHPNIYYSVEENAIILKAFLDELRIENVSIAGFSNGALSALRIAQNHPSIVDKLILISPGGPNETYPFLMRALTTAPGHFAFKIRFAHYTMENIIKDLYFNKPLVTDEIVAQYYEPYKNKNVRDTLCMTMHHFDDHFTLTELHGIKKDTLVFSGENDPIHSKKTAEKFASVPAALHRRIRNCGHFVNEEKPEVFNTESLDFLNMTEAEKIFV